jgi:ubiquinone/menaquinone biosynthesis C-methylase UbiE
MENQQTYFDHLGDDFEKLMDDYDVSRRCYLIFNQLLKDEDIEGKKVLEVGSGTGRISQEIVSRKADLTILDIGENLVRQVREKLSCKGAAGDACCLPFDSNSFEVVISSECIEHTLMPQKAIKEMCRVCRPGGIVCITSPNKLWYPVLWLSIKLNIRKFRGIENWLFSGQASSTMKQSKMSDIQLSGCHLWPFQLKFSRTVLRWFDKTMGRFLFPFMINYGIRGTKGPS